MTTLLWRSDQVDVDDQTADRPMEERWKSRVAEWARDIYMPDASRYII
jgi:hypothetical protein